MIRRLAHRTRLYAFLRDDDGATLVEFAIVISLFLLIFFGLLDFGRLAYHVVMAERAVHAGARVAAVRPPACAGVPEYLTINDSAPSNAEYGTDCDKEGGPYCAEPAPVTCAGDADNATANEIWSMVQTTLPGTSSISNLSFTYAYDERLGFLGGPYVPVVTVELVDVTFDFVTPLGALAVVAGATPSGSTLGEEPITLPRMSVSMPGEDLAQGENG